MGYDIHRAGVKIAMIELLYQNNKTGDVYDVASSMTALKWDTKRTGSPATLTFTVLQDDRVVWDHGGIVRLKDGEQRIFYGYVFKISRSEKDTVDITAYDQTRYLKNKETYVFANQRADQVLRQIAEDFKLKLGTLENTGYIIPSMVEDGQSLFDIVLKALDYTLINAGKMYYLWDDFGSLRISDVENGRLDLVIGDSSLATGYTYTTDIDTETYNKIKLVRDNKETGKRDVYLFQDSNNMTFWGILQDYEQVDENMNPAQIKERGAQMLELYNRPKKSFEVKALSDLSVRAGRAVFVSVQEIANQFFIIEEASHDLMKGTMSLKLKVV